MNRGMALLAAVALLLLANAGTADAIGGLGLGIKGGVNIANQSVNDSSVEQADRRNGLILGGWLRVPVSPILSIQPEALFSMKGDREESGGVTATTKMEYLEVPVLARVGIPTSMPMKPAIFAGPSVGLNLSAKATVEGSGLSGEIDVKDATKSLDMGITFGGGVEFNNIGLDVRYTHGLTNIVDGDTGGEVKNSVISVLGTIRFL